MKKGTLGRYALSLAVFGSTILLNTTAWAQVPDICTIFAAGPGITCTADSLAIKYGPAATDVLEGNDPAIANVAKAATAQKGKFAGTTLAVISSVEPNAYVDNTAAPTKLGVKAADSTCNAAFASSHVCTAREMIYAHNRSEIPAATIGAAFDTHPYVERGGINATIVTNQKASCGNFNYGTADSWSRTIWTIANSDPDALGGAVTGPTLRLDYGTAAGTCGSTANRLLACCR